MMLTKTIALLLTVVGAASASSVHSSTTLRGDDEDPISNLRSSLITTNRNLAAPKKKTLKKKKKKDGDEPPFGNAFGQDKEMKSCEKPLTLTLQATSELDTDTFYLLSAGALVFLMQAGFAMLMVRQKNVKNVMLKNILDANGSAWGTWKVLGPRIDADGNELSDFPPHSVALQVLGTFIVGVGWYGFNPGSTLATPNPASILSDLGDLVAAIQEQPLASVNEIEVEEEEDGSVSVRYGLSFCKDDGSDFSDEEVGGLKDAIEQELEEFIIGLAKSLGITITDLAVPTIIVFE